MATTNITLSMPEQLMSTGIGMRIGDIDWSRDELHAR
jgi:hypothetical protein